MTNPAPRFTGLFIPVEILEIEELSYLEMMLLAWIDALYSEEHGGCFASNEYLAQKLKAQPNTVVKGLTKLRKEGLIEDVSFNGRQRVIKALIGKKVHEVQSGLKRRVNPRQSRIKIPCSMGEKSYAGCDKNPSPQYIEKKEEIKDIDIARERPRDRPALNAQSSSCAKQKELPIKKKWGSHVQLTDEQKEELEKAHGEAKIAEFIERVNDYCASTGKAYKDYAATIRNWLRKEKPAYNAKPRNETVQERVRREQAEEYRRHNGSFDDMPNIIRFDE